MSSKQALPSNDTIKTFEVSRRKVKEDLALAKKFMRAKEEYVHFISISMSLQEGDAFNHEYLLRNSMQSRWSFSELIYSMYHYCAYTMYFNMDFVLHLCGC